MTLSIFSKSEKCAEEADINNDKNKNYKNDMNKKMVIKIMILMMMMNNVP